jgi:hypothetical protein
MTAERQEQHWRLKKPAFCQHGLSLRNIKPLMLAPANRISAQILRRFLTAGDPARQHTEDGLLPRYAASGE